METSLTIGQEETHTLIDQLLAEQQTLAPVVRFARVHQTQAISPPPVERGVVRRSSVAIEDRYYRDVIPLSKPKPGQQYAFEVDLDQCSRCKACVAARHNLNCFSQAE